MTYVTWVAMGIRGIACGVREISRHHVFRLGSLIGLRSVARFGWRDVGGPDGKIGELSYRY